MPDADPATTDARDERPGIVVLDVDGVLADVQHRLHHLERRPKDWAAFFAEMDDDAPLEEGVALARSHAAEGHRIVYLTGRNEDHRATTRDWMERHGLPAGRLVMRRADDRRPARVFKPAALRRIAQDGPVLAVIDDDAAVVEVLRRDGWPAVLATWMVADPAGQQSLFEAQEIEGRS
ncbi:MAG TPA: HAD family acid phosphatase [Candidatus Angelobacter sp.]|nr:HAD family acid phosphatase [Candidatus Angelobacter sp.]